MPNKTYASEWLSIVHKNLETAKLLHRHGHYTDIIGIEIQQAVEKALKAVLAYHNQKIPRDHDLVKLAALLTSWLKFSNEELEWLRIITDYYKDDRYPNPRYFIPSSDEISKALAFAEKIIIDIQKLID